MKRRYIFLAMGLGALLMLNACNQNNQSNQQQTISQEGSSQAPVEETKIQNFPQTENDANDIKALDDFDSRFNEMTDEMEAELNQLQQQGQLSPEFAQNRKEDHIRSALNMLSMLELKTAQGRYIQGLLYQYWENQAQRLHSDKGSNATLAELNEQMSDYLLAQQQLQHWKAQNSVAS